MINANVLAIHLKRGEIRNIMMFLHSVYSFLLFGSSSRKCIQLLHYHIRFLCATNGM